ncbi:CPBP family intramembrane metalloprotease [Sulfitobacter sp. S190]|nr:CPBP family intramembrane metalloprotease [Sulfitobacter sp. S190]
MVVLYLLLGIVYQQFLFLWAAGDFAALETLETGSTPQAMYWILFSFGLITAAVVFVTQTVHRRAGISVLGRLDLLLPQMARVFVVLLVLMIALAVLPPYDMGGPLTPNMAPGLWATLLPISLLAVFVQISAEEVLFRGFLQQQLAARFSSPLIWMVVPSALFAIGHYQPSEAGSNALLITLWAGMFGMLMADLTARAGSLGPALVVHFLNNVVAMLITSVPDSLSGLALFLAPFGLGDEEALRAWLPVDFAMMVVFWLGARLALRR